MTTIRMPRLVRKVLSRRWVNLHDPGCFQEASLRFPGVYILAYTSKRLQGRAIRIEDIYYVGMSNSAGGIRNRLRQFKRALEKGRGHSGGNRCYQRNGKVPFSRLRKRQTFYFAAIGLDCKSGKTTAEPRDFQIMGHIACLEYYVLAHLKRKLDHVPPLNRSAGGKLSADV